jgi:hypothetical protein
VSDWSFDATGTSAPAEFVPKGAPVPVGNHLCALTGAERKDIKGGNGWGFALEFTILDGPHKGRRAWPFLSIGHTDEKVRGYSNDDLVAMCHATGVMQVKDIAALFNIPMIAYWGQKAPTYEIGPDGKNLIGPDGAPVIKYQAKNTVRGFKPVPAANASVTPITNGAAKPTATNPNAPSWVGEARKAG